VVGVEEWEQFVNHLDTLLPHAEAVVLSGSLPRGLPRSYPHSSSSGSGGAIMRRRATRGAIPLPSCSHGMLADPGYSSSASNWNSGAVSGCSDQMTLPRAMYLVPHRSASWATRNRSRLDRSDDVRRKREASRAGDAEDYAG
jgi:hypothetical protein